MKLIVPRGIGVSRSMVESSAVFRRWSQSVGGGSWSGTITVLRADVWDNIVHGLCVVIQRQGAPWPDQVILRSATVDVQVRVTDGRGEPFVLLVSQWRDSVGQYVLSNSAGGISWGESPTLAALREASEETGLPSELFDRARKEQFRLRQLSDRPVIVSPGVTNELTYFYLAEITMAHADLAYWLKEWGYRTTGLAAEGESIKVLPVPASNAVSTIMFYEPDAKTLLSLKLSGL